MTKRFTASLILAFALSVPAMAAAPLNALTDKGDSFNAVIVEKDKKKLHVVRVTGNGVSEIKSVTVMTGRADGDKRVSGDAKTPEGVYHVTGFLSPQRLKDLYGDMSKIYGYGAFPISYPNRLDEMQGKTGGGIWLHGVENNRQDPSTKGCVAFDNDDVRAVARYIATGTPVVITRNAITGSSAQYRKMFEAAKETVIRYLKAWGENDFDSFRQAYSSSFRSSDGRSINSYVAYKRGLASSNPIRLLSADKFRVFYESENEAVAQFYQYYTAGNLSSYGRKTLYLRREGGSMKIVAEEFEATKGWTVNPSTVLVRAETPKKSEAVAMVEKPKKPETVAMAEPARKSSAVAVPDKRPEKQKDLIVAMTAMPKPPRAEKYIKPDDFAEREDLGKVPEVKETPAEEPVRTADTEKPQTQAVMPAAASEQPKTAEPVKHAETVKTAETVKPVVQSKPIEIAKPAPDKPAAQPTEIKKPVEVVLLDNSVNTEENAMRDFVGEWAEAWASKDIDRYISHYSIGFRSGGMDLAAWKKDKGRKFGALSDIRVDIADVQVRKVSDKVYDVTFMQRYKGDTYNDTGYKTLRLDNSTGEPLVVSETYKHTSAKFPEARAFVMAPTKGTPAVDKLVAMTPAVEKQAAVAQAPAKPMQIIGKPSKVIEQPVEQPVQKKEIVTKQTPVVTPAATPTDAPKQATAKPVVLSEEVIEPRPAAATKPETKPAADTAARTQPEKAKPAPAAEAPIKPEKQETIVKPEPAKAAVADASVASVYDFLIGWKSAWEARDIDRYIALYDGSFRSGRMNLAAWKADKQRKFAALSVVHVDLDNIRVTALSDHVFEVTLTQRYTGDRYSDTGIKTLRLDNASGNVLITSELWRAK